MSLTIETINHGEVDDFGFIFRTDIVYLGDKLPPIPLGQFSRYATEALLKLRPSLSPENRTIATEYVTALKENYFGSKRIKIRDSANFQDLPRADFSMESTVTTDKPSFPDFIAGTIPPDTMTKFHKGIKSHDKKEQSLTAEAMLIAANKAGGFPQGNDYPTNPFAVTPDGNININGLYIVGPVHFSSLVYHTLAGGFLGFDEDLGVPDFILEDSKKLIAAFIN